MCGLHGCGEHRAVHNISRSSCYVAVTITLSLYMMLLSV